jgi:Ni/Co efflux regulator RcnB
MKRFFLLTTIVFGSSFAAGFASAHEVRTDDHIAMTWPWSDRLADAINHLNRMRGHVRWEFRNHKSNRQIRHDFLALSHEIDHINSQYRQGGYNRRQLRGEIERAHHELHRIEVALHVRPRDFYPWR